MSYELVPRFPGVDDYRRLRTSAGLDPKTIEAATRGLSATWFGVSVNHGAEVVGMGRIIGDGGCFFQVVDIAVLPEHQKKGLGKKIMAALCDYMEKHVPPSASVSLLADGQAHRLYAQYGFALSAPESLGMLRKF